tara:strand:- start:463 stop:1113 length:651 start_codon:yes stop_codon:yes gene_type:complete
MYILAVDSANDVLSVSLKIKDKVNTDTYDDIKHSSEILLVAIDKLLSKNGLQPSDLNCILYNKGPASFTGTRVAASCLQAIGFSKDIPVIGISSMHLMAGIFSVESSIESFTCIKYAYGEMCFSCDFVSDNLSKQMDSCKLVKIDELNLNTDKFKVLNEKLYQYLRNTGKELTETNKVLARETNSEDLISYCEKYLKIEPGFNLSDSLPDYANHQL